MSAVMPAIGRSGSASGSRSSSSVHAAITDYHQWQWPQSPATQPTAAPTSYSLCSNYRLPSTAMAPITCERVAVEQPVQIRPDQRGLGAGGDRRRQSAGDTGGPRHVEAS